MKEGDAFRVLVLFERCLVVCAQYEDMWCKYARYLEQHVANVKAGVFKEETIDDSEEGSRSSVGDSASVADTNTAAAASDASKTEGAEASAEKSVSNENLVKDNENKDVNQSASDVDKDKVVASDSASTKDSEKVVDASDSNSNNNSTVDGDVMIISKENIKSEPLDEEDDVVYLNESNSIANSEHIADRAFVSSGGRSCWTYEDVLGYVCSGVSLVGRVLRCSSLTKKWVYEVVDWEDVRQVYRRAAWIHCPNKPTVAMQWAYFEEMQGNVSSSSATNPFLYY